MPYSVQSLCDVFLLSLVTAFALSVPTVAAEVALDRPVKVFLLAGQSNMEGKAKVALLEHQIDQTETREQFTHLRQDGQWVERDDVWIKFLDRKGKLTIGYGSPGCIGPELEFGNAVGDHFDEQVLIIKTAWGGRSLFRDFRPPSAGLPSEEVLRQMLQQVQRNRPEATLVDVEQLFDGETIVFYFLGPADDDEPELAALTGELAALYEAKVQFRRFAETLTQGCGPGCGTESAAGCGSACSSCAVAGGCTTRSAAAGRA